jgi:hypothetical protein
MGIQLIWKKTGLVNETTLLHEVEAFQKEFADYFDWAHVVRSMREIIAHT